MNEECRDFNKVFHEQQQKFLIKNAEFLLLKLLEVVQTKYKDCLGYECPTLANIQTEYSAILKGVTPTARSTKTKYSSDFL